MPELPEVETIARQLQPLVCGREVLRLELLDPLLGLSVAEPLEKRRVERVARLGKQVVLSLGTAPHAEPLWLAFHLRMTGRLIWWPVERGPEPQRVRARLWLVGGALLFADLRRFGTLVMSPDLAALQPAGLDPLDPGFDVKALARLLRGSTQPIKTWLLRQDRLVGLGNIYACEALFRAGIDPRRRAGDLGPSEVRSLRQAIVEVLQAAIANCGTTFSDFQDAHGVTGAYQRYLRVYGREGEACARCGSAVSRLVQQQRSTFYCPSCQPGRSR